MILRVIKKNFGEAAKRVGHRPCSFSCPKYRVSVQGVGSLGGHFATLCRGFDFFEVKINKKYYYFSKRKGKYFYTFNHF